MEGGENGPGGARWNPTKEQISMLESFYKQGLRTPTAEQIHQITVRLKAYGHIEGKNVFYWFQNHKARQRQKQKQDQNLVANYNNLNRFLHPTPIFPSYHNVNVCHPCYIPPPPPQPQNDRGLYQQYPKVQLPVAGGGFKRRLLIQESKEEERYNKVMQHDNPRSKDDHQQETLDLFPMHPTGILQAKNHKIHHHENDCSTTSPTSSQNDGDNHPFFDFFCGKFN